MRPQQLPSRTNESMKMRWKDDAHALHQGAELQVELREGGLQKFERMVWRDEGAAVASLTFQASLQRCKPWQQHQ